MLAILRRLGLIRGSSPAAPVPEPVFDLATGAGHAADVLLESGAYRIAIVTDHAGALEVAGALAAKGKKVSLICIDDATADRVTLSLPESCGVAVSSLAKHFAAPLSQLEGEAAGLARVFCEELSEVLGNAAKGCLSAAAVDSLTEGLRHFLYFDAARFHAARSCLQDFGATLLLFQDAQANADVIGSFAHHAAGLPAGRVYLSAAGSAVPDISTPQADEAPQDEGGDVNAGFSALWHALLGHAGNCLSDIGVHVAVCGNVVRDNYAPASWKLVDMLTRESSHGLIFHSSDLLHPARQEETRRAFLERKMGGRCRVHEASMRRYREIYPPSIFEQSARLRSGMLAAFLKAARSRLPQHVVEIFRPRLHRYMENLFAQLIFMAEATRMMERCRLVATSMDVVPVSHILCAIARDKNVPAIGIQPQLISVSPRYGPAAVDRMGVIDSAQAEIYRALGTPEKSLEVVGSVNYVDRLRKMDAVAAAAGAATEDRRSILFALQHSNAAQMIATSAALNDIARRHGLGVAVKPHPNQELPVLHEVRRIFASCATATVLPSGSDTYAYIPRCAVVVGLNSNVLMESALAGKPVVIAAFSDLHPSIDFSLVGLALKAPDADTLEKYLLDIIADGPLSQQLAADREAYLRRNPQFSRPYTHNRIESFITSALRD